MMKKFIVLLAILVLVAPAMATTFTGNSTESTHKPSPLTAGQTVNTSTTTWAMSSSTPPGLTATSGPYTGAIVDDGTGTKWYKASIQQSQYGSVVNVDTTYGDGTTQTYYSADTTNNVVTYNSLGKLLVSNGTMNVQAAIWADKLQGGTANRTSTGAAGGVTYWGKSVMNIGTGGVVHVTGTDVIGNNSGNMALSYGANVDAYVNMSGTGVLSGVYRDGLGNYIGGRTLCVAKNSNAGDKTWVELNGSDVTVEAASLNLHCGNATGQSTLRFITDADGASAIQLYGAGTNAVTFGASSKLDIQLGAALTEGQILTLINLVDATGGYNVAQGRFKTLWGTTIGETSVIDAWFGGVMYGLRASYVGGTGNDFTLTVIPEPATLAVLGLGGLFLRRRLA